MRIIISSKYLQTKLNNFDFKKDGILSVNSKKGLLYLNGRYSSIELWTEHKPAFNHFDQDGANWDWVKKLMNQVDEQPIVLDIAKNSVQIIFQY